MRPLFKLIKIVNATSLSGFHIRKQMPPPTVIWYGTSISVFSFILRHSVF